MGLSDTDFEPGNGPGPNAESELNVDLESHLTTEELPAFRKTPSLKPALIVVGIALVVIVLFGTLSAVFGTNNTPTPTGTHPASSGSPRANVVGTNLTPISATHAFTPVLRPGSPPRNVMRGLVIPDGARVISHTSSTGTGGTGQFDAAVTFSVSTSQETLITFFRRTLDLDGWKTFSDGSAHGVKNGIEVLSQKAGSDGWYWEAGAVISPTQFGNADQETTQFSVRLFQVPDPF